MADRPHRPVLKPTVADPVGGSLINISDGRGNETHGDASIGHTGQRQHTGGRRWRLVALMLLAVTAVIAGVTAGELPGGMHRVVFQIDSDDAAAMRHAVSNSINLVRYYKQAQQPIKIEIVAYGRGIDMFRTDTSPVRRVLEFMHAHFPEIAFVVCGNTTAIMERQERHPLTFIEGTRVVPFGIVEIVRLQEAGWSYVRP